MSTGTGPKGGQREDRASSSEQDARDLAERLRSEPAEEIVAELVSMMLSTAQVKLGRRDARLFIDLCALTMDHAGRYLSDDLNKQVAGALGQLRLGQVSAENELAKKGQAEPNDLSRIPTAPTPGGHGEAESVDHPAAPASKPSVSRPLRADKPNQD